MALAVCVTMVSEKYTKADLIEKDTLEVSSIGCRVTNSYGEYLDFTGAFKKLDGTMNVFDEEIGMFGTAVTKKVLIETDEKYTVSNIKGYVYVSVDGNRHGFSVDGDNIKQVIMVNKKEGSYMQVKSDGGYCHCTVYMNQSHNVTGIVTYSKGTITFKDTPEGVVVRGLSGMIDVALNDFSLSETGRATGTYYTFGQDLLIKKNGIKLILPGTMELKSQKTTKTLKNIRIKPINNNKEMLLTWSPVEKAAIYKVYRYDYAKKKYIYVTSLEKSDVCCYGISNIVKDTKYKYAVRAYSYNKTKRKYKALGKRVAVMAVSGDSVKGNVSKVKLKKKTIKAKVGKKVKIKYTLKVDGKKKPISKKLTWYTSNKKIATFKKGKLVLKKKGKCKIYAMAHNGVVSKTIKIKAKK